MSHLIIHLSKQHHLHWPTHGQAEEKQRLQRHFTPLMFLIGNHAETNSIYKGSQFGNFYQTP